MARPSIPLRPPRRASADAAGRAGWTAAAVGVVLGLALALSVFAPARWLAHAVESASEGRVLLAAPRGTVWNGSAQLVLAGGAGSADATALPDRLQWRLRPAWAGMRLALDAACCTPQPLALRLRVGWDGLHTDIADGGSHWPAALLAGLGTPFNTLQPEGMLTLRTAGLALHTAAGRLAVSGRADIDALDMASRLSPLRPLGSYRVTLEGGDLPGLRLSTLGGPLQLSGSGQWVGNRLRFTGEARALPERETALSTLLNLLGRREGAVSVITLG